MLGLFIFAISPLADFRVALIGLFVQDFVKLFRGLGDLMIATDAVRICFRKRSRAYRTKCVSTLGASAQVDAPFSAV